MNSKKFRSIAKNRRAHYDFQIDSSIEAGIILSGPEVKSVRNGMVSLRGSFAVFKGDELWVSNMHITKYKNSTSDMEYNPTRLRKLLLHKKELRNLQAKINSGNNLVVLEIGSAGNFIKLRLGLGHGKKLYDKRQKIKARDQQKDIEKRVKS